MKNVTDMNPQIKIKWFPDAHTVRGSQLTLRDALGDNGV
jgi:hypothetical protein